MSFAMKHKTIATTIACLALASLPSLAQDAPKPEQTRPATDRSQLLMREARERMAQAKARMEKSDVKPWRIGLMVDPIDATLRSHLEIPEKSGVIVTACAENSPASKAGIKKNDIILMVNGRPVGSIEPLRDAVESSGKTGEPLRLSTLRKGQRREVTIKPDLPKPPVESPMARPTPPTPPVNPGMMREQEMMMRRMAEQNKMLTERLERQENEIKRMREQVEQMTKAMREIKRDEKKDN
jgi:S1-C subfamily serine protease